MKARMGETEPTSGFEQPLIYIQTVLYRDIELPTQLADIGHPARPYPRITYVDFSREPERMRLIRQIGAGQAGEKIPTPRAHESEHRDAGSHIGYTTLQLRCVVQFLAEAGEVTCLADGRGHNQEVICRESR